MASRCPARLLAALLALVTWLSAGVAMAYQPPPSHSHVNDRAGVLSSARAQSLEAELSRLRREQRYDIAVLIVASLGDEPIEDVAYDTFNTWGIGDAELDNGVLLVIAVAEQRVRIETGKGVGGELTDIESGRIIREQIKPLVVAGRWDEATSVGTRAITEALTGAASPRGPPPASDAVPELTLVQKILLGVGLLVLIILAIIFPQFRRVLFWILMNVLSRGGGGRGGGGHGGGGRMGGGGRSGGGGASG